MWPPSKGIIGIRLAKPSRKFIQTIQNRKSNSISIPSVPRADAMIPSPARIISLSSSSIVCPSYAIGIPIIPRGASKNPRSDEVMLEYM